MTNRQLAERLDVDAAAASVLVKDLEEHGLVTRTPSEQDKRSKIARLTPAGEAAMADLRTRELGFDAFAGLTDPERLILHQLLAKLQQTEPITEPDARRT